MTSFGIADDAQLASLTRILDDQCTKFCITNDREAREVVAWRIMALFNCGYSMEQIEQELPQAWEEAA